MKFKKIYIVDTNIFVWIHKYYPKSVFTDLWDRLDELFEQGRITSHITVFDEICHNPNNKDILAKWITGKREYFIEITQRQLDLTFDVVKNFPKLIDSNRESEQADPWLIAAILELKKENNHLEEDEIDYVLVCGESRRSPFKLPAACKFYDITEVNLIEFFQENGWTFRIN